MGRLRKHVIRNGDRFGRLTVIRRAGPYVSPNGQRFRRYRLECECGRQVSVVAHSLYMGRTRSCGCLEAENRAGGAATTHGLSGHALYETWKGMHARCRDQKHTGYADYGGRGITVCDRWSGPDGFPNFLADVGERPGPEYTIDRRDNDGPYSPENCRWATPEQQRANKRPRRPASAPLTFRDNRRRVSG